MTKKILLEDALILNFTKALRALAHALPPRVSLAVARGVGGVIHALSKRRKIAYKNLRAAFAGEKSRAEMHRIARLSVQNLAMSAVELLRFPDMNEAYIRRHMSIVGAEKFEPVLRQGRGIIFLTAHFGNWEILSIASGLVGYPMMALARVQKHPRSDAYLNSLRSSQGSRIAYKGMNVREILKSLKGGGIVGMLSDQDGGRNGTFVHFFDRLSSSPSGVATFALRTGAPIYPVFDFRESPTNHHVEVEGPLALPDPSADPEEAERFILQQFADMLEAKIRRSPEQWLWAHRRWKSTPDRSVVILSDKKSGHVNQSLAAARAIQAHMDSRPGPRGRLRTTTIEVAYRSGTAKKMLDLAALVTRGHLPFKHAWLKHCLSAECYRAVMGAYADIVVSCGSSTAAVNLLAAEENQARSLVIMKPSFGTGAFDAAVVPQHDGVAAADNIFITEKALSVITEDVIEKEAAKLAREIGDGGKKIGVLLGGDTDALRFEREKLETAVDGIRRVLRDAPARVLVTTSRRTPAWAETLLKRMFADRNECPLLVLANEANREGAVAGILGLSDIVVVSGESISMVSEALSSGKPVIVFLPADEKKIKPKLREFIERLVRQKRVLSVSPDELYGCLRVQLHSPNGAWAAPVRRDGDVLKAAAQKVAQ